jgi:thioredoxin 1
MVAYITECNNSNYNEITDNGLVLVDIYADWCGPCKQISPLIDQLSREFQGKLTVAKLDADKNTETVEKLGIRSIPTLFLYKDGKILEKLNGMQTYQTLTGLVNKHL